MTGRADEDGKVEAVAKNWREVRPAVVQNEDRVADRSAQLLSEVRAARLATLVADFGDEKLVLG